MKFNSILRVEPYRSLNVALAILNRNSLANTGTAWLLSARALKCGVYYIKNCLETGDTLLTSLI